MIVNKFNKRISRNWTLDLVFSSWCYDYDRSLVLWQLLCWNINIQD